MKILITNLSLRQFAGSERFVIDLSREFIKLGHTIHAITLDGSNKTHEPVKMLESIGVKVIDAIEDVDRDYDVIHCHHNSVVNIVNKWLPDIPKIYVCHGIYFPVCMPNKDIEFKQIVAVSEEVKGFLEARGYKNVVVINNPINLTEYPFIEYDRENIKNIIVASNHAGKPCKRQQMPCQPFEMYKEPWFYRYCMTECKTKPQYVIERIGKELGAQANHVGGKLVLEGNNVVSKNYTTDKPFDKYKTADVVIAIGRTALQSMAMGVPTMIYDHFGCAGFMTGKFSCENAKKTNFSGRKFGKFVGDFPEFTDMTDTEPQILTSFRKGYEIAVKNRKEVSDWVRNNYDSTKIASKYLNLYQEAVKK